MNAQSSSAGRTEIEVVFDQTLSGAEMSQLEANLEAALEQCSLTPVKVECRPGSTEILFVWDWSTAAVIAGAGVVGVPLAVAIVKAIGDMIGKTIGGWMLERFRGTRGATQMIPRKGNDDLKKLLADPEYAKLSKELRNKVSEIYALLTEQGEALFQGLFGRLGNTGNVILIQRDIEVFEDLGIEDHDERIITFKDGSLQSMEQNLKTIYKSIEEESGTPRSNVSS